MGFVFLVTHIKAKIHTLSQNYRNILPRIKINGLKQGVMLLA